MHYRFRPSSSLIGRRPQLLPRECTESFLEGHIRAFEFLGGVPTRISYDNSKIAVVKIVGNRERKMTREFLRLQSHFLFEEHFCLVRRPNEKGHVEHLLDFARKNYLVPVPHVDSLETLNRELEQRCRKDLERHLRGKPAAKKELLAEEQQDVLRPLPNSPLKNSFLLRVSEIHCMAVSSQQSAISCEK